MEPVVTLEGVKKLPARAERQAPALKAQGSAGAQVPLDGHSVLYVNLDRETLLIAGVGKPLPAECRLSSTKTRRWSCPAR